MALHVKALCGGLMSQDGMTTSFSVKSDSIAEVMSGGKKKVRENMPKRKAVIQEYELRLLRLMEKLGGSQCQYCRLCLPLVISERAEGIFLS